MKRTKLVCNAVATRSSGFSIIEVLIFTVLASMVLIAMSYATLISVRTSQSSQNKTLSTRYVQQAQEWLTGQKELGWNEFSDALDLGVYCLNTIPESISSISSQVGACATTEFSLGGRFKRELTITSINVDNTEITYTIKTYWRDGSNIVSAQVSSLLASWE